MATQNPFELLGDEEADASAVLERAVANAKRQQQQQQASHQQAPAKLPSKPVPPAQAVRETRFSQTEGDRGRGRAGRGGGRGAYNSTDPAYSQPGRLQGDRYLNDQVEGYNREGNTGQRGRGRRGGYGGRGSGSNWEDGEGGQYFEGSRGRGRGRGRGRSYGEGFGGYQRGYGASTVAQEHQGSYGSGRGNGFKKDDDASGNWGDEGDQGASREVEPKRVEEEKQATDAADKQPGQDTKSEPGTMEEKKEDEEDKEMLLEEYYKIRDEKRKNLQSMRTEERKVMIDKDFERMERLEKKQDASTFATEKDKGKKKEVHDKDEKARKSVSINEFLRSSEGGEYTPANRRGRGRGRGDRGGFRGGFGGNFDTARQDLAPRIEDPGQFPTLGGK